MNALVDWREVEGGLAPFLVEPGRADRKIDWAAQPGSQTAFLACPVFGCLLTGSRGSGKTDVLLMDFAQHLGHGWGRAWRGVLFRRTYPELEDVIGKSEAMFSIAFPGAVYNRAKGSGNFPTARGCISASSPSHRTTGAITARRSPASPGRS